MWVEQSYKQVKHALGWSEYQVRSDSAIRRHWQLVCCAFSFCWYHQSHPEAAQTEPALQPDVQPKAGEEPISEHSSAVGGKNQRPTSGAAKRVLAPSPQNREGLAGALGLAPQILAGVVGTAPTAPAPTTF